MDNKLTSIALGVGGIAFFLGVSVGMIRYPEPVTCEQSEVLTHSGHCWPIEDAWMLQVIR